MPQSPFQLALLKRQPTTPQTALDQTPLEQTNPYLAKVRDFLGGVSGLRDPVFEEGDPSLPLAIGSILGTLGGTNLPKGLWSRTQRALESVPFKQAHPNKWLSTIQNAGSPEEAEFTGLNDFLKYKNQQPVSKDEVVGYAQENPLKVGETVYGGPKNDQLAELGREYQRLNETLYSRPFTPEEFQRTVEIERTLDSYNPKYSQYTLPGGRDHTERVLSWEGPYNNESAVKTLKHYQRWLDEPGEKSSDTLAYVKRSLQEAKDQYNPHIPTNPEFTNHAFDVPNALGWSRSTIRDTPNSGPFKFLEELQSDVHQKGAKAGYRQTTTRPDVPFFDFAKTKGVPEDDAYTDYMQNGPLWHAWAAQRSEWDAAAPNAPFKSNEWANLLLKRELVDAADQDLAGLAISPGAVQSDRWSGHGNSELYDRVLPKQLEKLVKPLGGQVETVGRLPMETLNEVAPKFANNTFAPFGNGILGVRLTPEMKKLIKEKGFYALSPIAAALLQRPSRPEPMASH